MYTLTDKSVKNVHQCGPQKMGEYVFNYKVSENRQGFIHHRFLIEENGTFIFTSVKGQPQ